MLAAFPRLEEKMFDDNEAVMSYESIRNRKLTDLQCGYHEKTEYMLVA
jgi:hypothetical protein